MIVSNLKRFFKTKMFTLLIILGLLVLCISVASGGFFIRPSNIQRILDSMFITSMLTIGAAFLLISGHVDLSVGSVGTGAGLMLGFLLRNLSFSWLPALALVLLMAAAFGALNATLVNIFRFPAFIATLAVASVAEGLSYTFSGGAFIPVTDVFIRFIGAGRIGGAVPVSIVVVLAMFISYGLILSKTKFGRQAYLVGGNPQASFLSGINPKKISYALFVNSAVLAALAGVLLAARTTQASSIGIKGQQFTGLTAAILGGVAFGGGTGGMGGAFVGLLILTAFANGMVVLHFDSYWSQVINGAMLLLALTLDYVRKRNLFTTKTLGRGSL